MNISEALKTAGLLSPETQKYIEKKESEKQQIQGKKFVKLNEIQTEEDSDRFLAFEDYLEEHKLIPALRCAVRIKQSDIKQTCLLSFIDACFERMTNEANEPACIVPLPLFWLNGALAAAEILQESIEKTSILKKIIGICRKNAEDYVPNFHPIEGTWLKTASKAANALPDGKTYLKKIIKSAVITGNRREAENFVQLLPNGYSKNNFKEQLGM
ncbi:MAG: hypothetical protein WC460_03410 [Patescibacteria group bacterium]